MSGSRMSSRGVRRSWLVAAAASTALALAGCGSDELSQHRVSSTSIRDNNAVEASATVSAQAPASTSEFATFSMAYPTGDRSTSDLWLQITAPREARVGQPYKYQIQVTNLRNIGFSGLVLEQRIPATLRLSGNDNAQSSQPQAAEGKDAAPRIVIGDLGPQECKTVELTGIASQQGTIDTCLMARYQPPKLCASVAIVAPAITAIAEGPSQADVCQELLYKYTVTNTGTGMAHNVVVEATLPAGLQTADGQQSFSATIGDLQSNEAKSVTMHLRATRPGTVTSQAIVRSDDAGRAEVPKISTNLLAPRLAVTVAGPKEAYAGQRLSYQVTVKNTGDAAASGGKLRMAATPGMAKFVSAQNPDGSNISQAADGTGHDLGTIEPGSAKTVTLTFTSEKDGKFTVVATAEARCAEAVTTPVDTQLMVITAAALEVSHDPDPVRVGSNVIYHIKVTNKGNSPDRNIVVAAALPDSEQYINGTGDSAVTANAQIIAFGAIAELQPKQTATWNVEVKALKIDEAIFKVSMTSESTKTPAIKVEPTKLYGKALEMQEKTNEAKQAGPANPAATPPTTAPAGPGK